MRASAILLAMTAAVISTPLFAQNNPEQPLRQQLAATPYRETTTSPTSQPSRFVWRGLVLSDLPAKTNPAMLSEIYEEKPAGSKSFEVRGDVRTIRVENGFDDGTVYWNPEKNLFYVQCEEPGSSLMRFYGPVNGSPFDSLKPPPTTQPWAD